MIPDMRNVSAPSSVVNKKDILCGNVYPETKDKTATSVNVKLREFPVEFCGVQAEKSADEVGIGF